MGTTNLRCLCTRSKNFAKNVPSTFYLHLKALFAVVLSFRLLSCYMLLRVAPFIISPFSACMIFFHGHCLYRICLGGGLSHLHARFSFLFFLFCFVLFICFFLREEGNFLVLDTPHNLNAWNRLQTNINFITLHTYLCFTINILKTKNQGFIVAFIRCL